MKVLIWGYYSRGNFGDDAMAILIAQSVQSRGWLPIILTPSPYFDPVPGVEICSTLEDCGEVQAAVIGGGGLMNEVSFLRRIWNLRKEPFKADLADIDSLNAWLQANSKKILPISIGGCGKKFGKEKATLLSTNAIPGTVRLKSDIEVLRSLGITGYTHYPDILWKIPEAFGVSGSHSSQGKSIGFNIKAKHAGRSFLDLMSGLTTKHQLSLKNVTSHVDRERYSYENEFENVSTISYTGNLPRFLEQLGALSIVVSSKLHVGLAAMSLGVPFVSYKGPAKTHAALREIGLDRYICDSEDQLLRILEDIMENYDVTRKLIGAIAAKESALAGGHLEHLAQTLSNQPDK